MRGIKSLLAITLLWLVPAAAFACPFCSGSLELTFSQQIEEGVTAIIARQAGGRSAGHQATFVVLDILKASNDLSLNVREPLEITAYLEGATGDLYFIVAGFTGDGQILWGPPQPISMECRQYILQRPDFALPRSERLAFYANFLEHSDSDVAIDAWTEFASAQFDDIAPIQDRLPHERLANIVAEERDGISQLHSPEWLGLYGMLLGLCGNDADARVMREMILQPSVSPDMPRFGIDGIMAGLLLLQGVQGLDLLESNIANQPSVPISEHLAVRNACSFMWSFGDDRIPKHRLQQVVRNYLREPRLAAVVLPDLGRWKDWESIALIKDLYDDSEYADAVTQKEIVQFLLAAEHEAASIESVEQNASLAECVNLLDHYRQHHPAIVRGAEAGSFR